MRWLASISIFDVDLTAMLPSLHRRPELPEHEDVRGVPLLEPEGFLGTLQDIKLLIGPLEFHVTSDFVIIIYVDLQLCVTLSSIVKIL